jgi:hypothetical protein
MPTSAPVLSSHHLVECSFHFSRFLHFPLNSKTLNLPNPKIVPFHSTVAESFSFFCRCPICSAQTTIATSAEASGATKNASRTKARRTRSQITNFQFSFVQHPTQSETIISAGLNACLRWRISPLSTGTKVAAKLSLASIPNHCYHALNLICACLSLESSRATKKQPPCQCVVTKISTMHM